MIPDIPILTALISYLGRLEAFHNRHKSHLYQNHSSNQVSSYSSIHITSSTISPSLTKRILHILRILESSGFRPSDAKVFSVAAAEACALAGDMQGTRKFAGIVLNQDLENFGELEPQNPCQSTENSGIVDENGHGSLKGENILHERAFKALLTASIKNLDLQSAENVVMMMIEGNASTKTLASAMIGILKIKVKLRDKEGAQNMLERIHALNIGITEGLLRLMIKRGMSDVISQVLGVEILDRLLDVN